MEKPEVLAFEEVKGVDSNTSSIQPFKLVKYFSYTSLAVIMVASFLLSWVISNNAKKVLLERSEAYSELFAENLNRQVFLRFVLPTVVQYGSIALRNRAQFERLDTIVENVTRGMGIDSVSIYDSNENIISYSTIPELVGKTDRGGIEYQKALKSIPLLKITFPLSKIFDTTFSPGSRYCV